MCLGLAACDGSKAAEPTKPEAGAASVEPEAEPAAPQTAPAGIEDASVTDAMHPAAAHCVNNGGKLEMAKSAKGGTVDVCVFEDGSRCRAWAFERGECKPGDCQAPDGKCPAE